MKISSRTLGALRIGLSLCGGLVTSVHAAPVKGMAKAALKPTANGKKPPMQRMFDAISVTPE